MNAILISLATIAVFLVSPFFFAVTLFAQEQELIIDSSAEYSFGQQLRFKINIENASEVEKITLNVRPKLSNDQYVIDVPYDPGSTISVTHEIDVAAVNLLPYSQLSFFLELHTADGLKTTPEDTIIYEDDRFVWQQMSREGLTAHWTGSGPFLGQDILSVAGESLSKLSVMLPLEHISPIDIYVYPSTADLRSGLRLAGLRGDTSSYPELGVILVTAVNPQSILADLGQSLPYEMTRLLLYRAAGSRQDNIPWWVTEGLATSVQAQPHPRYSQLIESAARSGQIIPVSQLCQKTERIGDRALLASAQSHSLVQYLLERYGTEAFVSLVRVYIQGDECEPGLSRVFGISFEELDEAWLAAQQPPSAMDRFISAYGLWLLLIFAGVILMLLVLRMTWHVSDSG